MYSKQVSSTLSSVFRQEYDKNTVKNEQDLEYDLLELGIAQEGFRHLENCLRNFRIHMPRQFSTS